MSTIVKKVPLASAFLTHSNVCFSLLNISFTVALFAGTRTSLKVPAAVEYQSV